MWKIAGFLYQGWVVVRAMRIITWLAGLVVEGGLYAWLMSAWDWLGLQPALAQAGIYASGALLLFWVTLIILGHVLSSYGDPAVPMSKIVDHISENTFSGRHYLWTKRNEPVPGIFKFKLVWDQLVWHGKRGLIHMRGYQAGSSIPQEILPEHWQAQMLGFDPNANNREWRISATGYNMQWDKPTLSERELYRFWPPIPFIKIYRKAKRWLAESTYPSKKRGNPAN